MKKRISTALLALCLVFGAVLLPLAPAVAASTVDEIQGGVAGVGGGSKEGGTQQVKDTISTVVNILLFLVGSFAVIMIVVSGFRLVTANGDSNTISQAKNMIIYAVIGIVVAVMAYAIVNFVLGAIT